MNTPQVKFRVEDFTATAGTPTDGVSFVLGKALRGRINTPDLVFNSWPSFLKEHGGMVEGNSAAKIKRIFEGGGSVRFCNLAHYSDIEDAETLTATKATTVTVFADDEVVPNALFAFAMKNPGADYNNIRIIVGPASNGLTTHFNVEVKHITDSSANELYPNLSIPVPASGATLDTASGYLNVIALNSKIVTPVYTDFVTPGDLVLVAGGYVTPAPATAVYAGGLDGGAITSLDMIGSNSTNTGLYAFDEYEDSLQIFFLLPSVASSVHIAANAYAAGRDDLQYWAFISETSKTKEAMIAERVLYGINSKHTNIFAEYIKVLDPRTGLIVEQDGLADIAGLAAQSDINFGTHFSFSGNKRGILKNVIGVAFNFGTAGRFNDLNELAQRQINVIINRDSQVKLWGSFTSLISETQERFIGVVRGTMSIKKNLRPLLEDYLEEPNDMQAWKLMYYQVKPYLDSLVERRALFSYRWEGDQDATSLQTLVTNNASDVTNGKYKVRLFLSFIASMQEIEVTLTLTSGNITFDEIANN